MESRAAKIGAINEKAAGANLPPRRDGLPALDEHGPRALADTAVFTTAPTRAVHLR